jgi:hypothetical protein
MENPSVRDALQELIESARLLGATQAKKGFGCYTPDDARFEHAMYESIAKHKAALSKQEAATPAIEREAFEAWISGPPYEYPVDRFGPDSAWPGNYCLINVDLAWQAWQAALKAAQPVPINVAAQEQVYSEAPAEGQRAYSPVAVAPDAPSDVVAVHSQHCDEHAECDDLRERMAALLTGVANALRGDPGPLRRWSWHDLPVRAAVMREQRDSAQADFKLLALDATPAPQEPAEPVATEQSTVPVYTQARPVRFIRDEQDCKTFMNEQALTLEELADCGLLSELEPPLYTQSVADAQDAWLEKLFVRKWNGVIDSGSRFNWEMRGDWRHYIKNMEGETFSEAVRAAMALDVTNE